MTVTDLRALHAVIGAAIEEIDATYKAQSASSGLPLDYPSLNVPYYSSKPSPADVAKSEELRLDPAVFGAANRIVAACGQLTASVHKPFFSLVETASASNVIACMQFMESAHIVEILREAGPKGASVKEIATKATEIRRGKVPNAPQLDPAKISHVLRLLATYHWVREVSPDVFANNRLSSFIDSGKSTKQLTTAPETKYDETDGVAAYVGWSADENLKFQMALTDWITSGGTQTGYYSPFNMAFKTERKYYEWLEEPGNELRLHRFGHAMNGTRQWEVTANVVHRFPWRDLPQNSVIFDVGGGIGSVSVVLAEAYPQLRFVVKDRASVVALALQSWGQKHAELFASGRVTFDGQDFFEPHTASTVSGVGIVSQPTVFLLRAVLHNWPDDDSRKILTHLRAAAGPHTKLFVADNLLPYACVDEETKLNSSADSIGAVRSLVSEDSPLLANLGRASANGYLLDISMLCIFGAKERTYPEMDALLKSAGWKITSVERAVGSLWAYIAAEPF